MLYSAVPYVVVLRSFVTIKIIIHRLAVFFLFIDELSSNHRSSWLSLSEAKDELYSSRSSSPNPPHSSYWQHATVRETWNREIRMCSGRRLNFEHVSYFWQKKHSSAFESGVFVIVMLHCEL